MTEYLSLHSQYVRFDQYTRQTRNWSWRAVNDHSWSGQTNTGDKRPQKESEALIELAALLLQIMDGILSFVSHRLLHGDFKPINVMVDKTQSGHQTRVKIVDVHTVVRFDVATIARNQSCCGLKPCGKDSKLPGEFIHVSTCPPECAACQPYSPDIEATWSMGFFIARGLADFFGVALPDGSAVTATSKIPEFFVNLSLWSNETWQGRELVAIAKCAMELNHARRCRHVEIQSRLRFLVSRQQMPIPISTLINYESKCQIIQSVKAVTPDRLLVDTPIPIVVNALPYCLSAELNAQIHTESDSVFWSSLVRIHRGVGMATAIVSGDDLALSSSSTIGKKKICLTLLQGDLKLFSDCKLVFGAFSLLPHYIPESLSGHKCMSVTAGGNVAPRFTPADECSNPLCSDEDGSNIVWGPEFAVTVSKDVNIARHQTLTILPGTHIRVSQCVFDHV